MSRLTDANATIAREIIGRFPRPKSALIPLLHLSQECNRPELAAMHQGIGQELTASLHGWVSAPVG